MQTLMHQCANFIEARTAPMLVLAFNRVPDSWLSKTDMCVSDNRIQMSCCLLYARCELDEIQSDNSLAEFLIRHHSYNCLLVMVC